ncbi:MAG: AmmeMemoRadiSam system protein B [Cytophagales bacterium]|nr:AmmeMemoRadiSam system protein B [Cytophagales bacterium]
MTTASMVRPPALANAFYAGDPLNLMREVDAQLSEAQALVAAQLPAQTVCPKILVVPHAGHVYSGLAASVGYARIAPHIATIQRIVMLCPAHREYFAGVALPNVSAFATPLGTMAVDALGVAAVSDLPFVGAYAKAHEQEHALEVHLPFLQRLWKDAPRAAQPSIVPMVVGDVSAEQVSVLIERLWGHTQTLIVISTDLSHFQTYAQANATDSVTCAKVRALHTDITHAQACGATPLNAALMLANKKQLNIEHLAYCNSGDTAGNTPEGRERVVGYASFALYEPMTSLAGQGLAASQGAALVQLARAALHHAVGAPAMPTPMQAPWLDAAGACFVTLSHNGQLRGCIGSLMAHRLIKDDVIHNAQAAALHDHRFTPVTADEAPRLGIEVSVLTAPVPLGFANEAHALWQLQPLVDGVIFLAEVNGQTYRSTFLPQVWAQMADAQQFMAQLKMKAGLPADFWSNAVQLQTYRVQEFHEDPSTGSGRTDG